MSDQLSSDLASLKIDRDAPPARSGSVRAAILGVVVLGAVAAGGGLALPYVRAQVFKTEIATTEVALVSPAQASVQLTSTGYVVAQTVSRVGAKRPGRVAKVTVKEGDTVKAGDLLVQLEDADLRAVLRATATRIASAQARVEAARAQLAEVEQQIKREQLLVEKGVVGRATHEDLVARRRSLEAQVKAAQADAHAASAEVEAQRVALEDGTVTSPIAGTLVGKPVEAGELVGPGVPIAEIADFSSLVVETDVPEGRLHLVKPGGPCEIVLDAYPSKRYRGRMLEIGKKVNRAKATIPVKVQFVDPMENVLPDMSARVGFLAEELAAEAMKEPPKKVLPASAIAERAGAKVVFVVESGKVRMVPVTVGAAFGSGFELLQGPSPGARLVSNPPPEMADGLRIKEKSD